MRGLSGKVAIVAGGATGIGAVTALRLAAEGAAVVVGDINIEGTEQVAGQIAERGGRAMAVHFDIADDLSVANLVAVTVENYGGLDIMHANAADLSVTPRDTDAVDVALEIFDRTIAANLRGHLLCTRHAIPALLKRGGGSMIYTSSAAAYVGEPVRVSYAISKAGMTALMRHVASRWGKEGIRANAIAPGLVLNEDALALLSGERRQIALEAGRMALEVGRSLRIGHPEDIAAMVAMLASDDGEWINGQVISVDGGLIMR